MSRTQLNIRILTRLNVMQLLMVLLASVPVRDRSAGATANGEQVSLDIYLGIQLFVFATR